MGKLAISRRIGERLKVGEAWVEIVGITDANQVRVAIEAPPHIGIWREELLGMCEMCGAGWSGRLNGAQLCDSCRAWARARD